MNESRAKLIASFTWFAAALVSVAAVYLWFVWAPRALPTPDDPKDLIDPSFIASPPVAGPPTREALEDAITRGRQAYVDKYLLPYLEMAREGGYLDYTDAEGQVERLGPDVYVQSQLYMLVHFLLYHEELGYPADDPLVREVHDWLMSKFDRKNGRWMWSEEGCLHPKSLIVLGSFGNDAEFEAGWEWARNAEFFRPRDKLYSIMVSGSIIQTLGLSTTSLSGELYWEHGSNVPDEENTAKYLYAYLNAGHSPDSDEARTLATALSDWLAQNPVALGYMQNHQLVGRLWTILAHLRFRLPPDDGFRMSLAVMREAGRGAWRQSPPMRGVPLFRALLVRALLEAGERGPELDAIVHGFVADQDADGSWPLPHTYDMWNMNRPPKEGYKYGNFDGSNTYMITLALTAYRDLVLKP